MIVIVTGGRKYVFKGIVRSVLARVLESQQIQFLVQGGCPSGADKFARDWAYDNDVPCVTYAAEWEKHGRKAGPIRNSEMLATYPEALVIAFPGGPGTADCVRKAKALGMKLAEVNFP